MFGSNLTPQELGVMGYDIFRSYKNVAILGVGGASGAAMIASNTAHNEELIDDDEEEVEIDHVS